METLNVKTAAGDISHSQQSLQEWSDAYRRVEAYFIALKVENRLMLSSLVLKILGRVKVRLADQPVRSVVDLAAEETDSMLVEWFRRVLHQPDVEPADRLSARGRLALLLIEGDVPWQQYFLSDEALPAADVAKMKTAYLHADPEFRFIDMRPRPIDLGIVEVAARGIERFGRFRLASQLLLWAVGIGVMVAVFFLSH